jgi:hypothetical protein
MYGVIWRESALDAMADAYVAADPKRRNSIEQAVIHFNAELAKDPYELGESRSGKRRIAFQLGCAITFVVDDPIPGVVRVSHFWTF